MPYTEKTYNTDTIIKKLNITTAISIDVIIALIGTKTYNLDILFQRLGVVKTYPTDVKFKKGDIPKVYSLDFLLETGIRQTNYLLDVALKKLDGTLGYSVDVRIRLADGETYLIDTVLTHPDATKTYLTDFKIKLANIIETYLLDSRFQVNDTTKTYSIDTIITTIPAFCTITNTAGSLVFKALKISERQSCHPAIRDIPTAQVGQILDTGTYVIQPKETSIVFRVSSTEKTTLEAIFDANEKVTVYLFNGSSYWKNIGWFREKSFRYEYSLETDATREWIVTVVFDFESSTFTVV